MSILALKKRKKRKKKQPAAKANSSRVNLRGTFRAPNSLPLNNPSTLVGHNGKNVLVSDRRVAISAIVVNRKLKLLAEIICITLFYNLNGLDIRGPTQNALPWRRVNCKE